MGVTKGDPGGPGTPPPSNPTLINQDSCPTRRTGARPITEGMTIFFVTHGVNKIEDFSDDFISVVL